MVAITFKETALPDFSDANALASAGDKQYETAVKGLQDAAKGVQEKVRNQNTARIQDYINKAANAAELRSPEYQEGLQAFLDTLGPEYDALGTAKAVDARFDTLNQRFKDQLAIQNSQDQLGVNKQQSTINDQTIAANEYTAAENLRKEAIRLNTYRVLTGQATTEQILSGGGEFDSKAVQDFIQSGGKYNLEQRTGEQQLRNLQAGYKQTEAVTEGQKLINQAKESENKLTGVTNNASYNAFTLANPASTWTPEQVKEVQSFGNAIVFASQPRKDGGVPYASYAHQKAEALGLDPDLVKTIFAKESAYNPNAVSEVGAVGIGQLMPATAQRFGLNPSERNNPYKNMDASLKYIKYLSDKFNGDTQKILIGYHSGEGNVEGVLRNPKGNPKSTADWQRSMRILDGLKAGNGGGSVIIPDGMNLTGRSGGTGQQSAAQIQKAYENSPEGIVANFKKTEGDLKTKSFTAPGAAFGGGTYKNPTEWATSMKDSGSDAMVTNMLDVTRKSNFKFSDKTAEKKFNKEGVKDWGKLSDNQKAGVLERAYNNLMQQNSSMLGLRTWNVGDADLVQFQKAIQAETDALLKPNKDTYARQLDSNRVNTFNRLKQQYKLADAQAVEYMQLDDESAQRLLGTTKTPPKAATTKAKTPDSELKDFAARVKLSYPNGKVPQAILSSLQGRAAAKAGLL